MVLSHPAESKVCGSCAQNLTEKIRFEWPGLVLLYPPHSRDTHVLVASSYTRTV